jgi:hypothetical protein
MLTFELIIQLISCCFSIFIPEKFQDIPVAVEIKEAAVEIKEAKGDVSCMHALILSV